MSLVHMIYLLLSIVVFITLSVFIINLMKGKSTFKKELLYPISFGLISIPFYCIFILSENHFVAILFNSLFYMCTDWLAFFMFCLVLALAGQKIKKNWLYCSAVGLLSLDSISMVLNCVFHHTYDIIWSEWTNGYYYWKLYFTPYHYLHLGLCYVFVVMTFVYLIVDMIKAPAIYKNKYSTILMVYLVVIVSNMICYNANLPVDFSILLYSLLAAFVCYYSTYLIPKSLVTYSLQKFNQSIDDCIICFAADKSCLYANPAAEKIFEENGKFSKGKAEKYRNEWVEKNSFNKDIYSNDEVFQIDGKEVHCSVEYQELELDGSVIGSYLKIQDRTYELNKLYKEQYISNHDQLTGIYNREHFFEACDEKLRKEPEVPRIMIASNIRDFKMLNELFGTRKGDELLCLEADMLKKLSHTDNVYGRITDDKLALLIRKEDFVLDVFIKAMKELEKSVESPAYQVRVTMGLCEIPGTVSGGNPAPRESASVLYDRALMVISHLSDDYQQIYAYYDKDMMDRLMFEKSIMLDFDLAVENQQFQLYFDPVIDKDNSNVGAEISVRWKHPVRGLMLPGFFTPVLDKTGYIYKLDLYIWEKTIQLIKQWSDKNVKKHCFMLKVSDASIYYMDVAAEIITLVDKYKIDPSWIIVEFSENLISSKTEVVKDVMMQLKEQNILSAIDDFGRGISSLNIIEQVPADILKVDASILRNEKKPERDMPIINFLSAIAKNLGMKMIAKGVESEEFKEKLKESGIEQFQNSASSPLNAKDYEEKFLAVKD